LWGVLVLSFAGYGFWGAYDEARQLHFVYPLGFTLEPTVGWAAYGVGTATLVVVGLIIVRGVRFGWLGKGWAVPLLLLSSSLSAVSPLVIIQLATRVRDYTGMHLFHGEHGVWLVPSPLFDLGIPAFAFVVFVVWAFIPKPGREEHR
jgi:hypothetical protein